MHVRMDFKWMNGWRHVYQHEEANGDNYDFFVEDVKKNHTTTLTMEDIKVDSGLDHSIFQEKNLKRMPRD